MGNQSQRCINLRASASIASRKLLLPGTSQQFIDDLLQRRRINVTPKGLCNFPGRVVEGWHVGEYTALSGSGNVLIYAGASVALMRLCL